MNTDQKVVGVGKTVDYRKKIISLTGHGLTTINTRTGGLTNHLLYGNHIVLAQWLLF